MKLDREHKVKILEYKFLYEEDIKIESEYIEGAGDLNYRLSFFREKLTKQENLQQKLKFDNLFGFKDDQQENALQINENEEATSAKKNKSIAESWVKKLYRKIVMITHPDKTKGIISAELIEKLTEQYRVAQESYNTMEYSNLIMIANDLNLQLEPSVIDKHINPAIKQKQSNINSMKSTLGWHWYNVPETQKEAELRKILLNLGFSFTEEQLAEVVTRKYIKRKVGTRPRKMNFKNKKK